jgi:hypothetical protein
MKIFSITMALLLLFGCKKDNTSTETLMEMEMAGSVRTHSGRFVNGPYGRVTGNAHIVRNANGTFELLLEGLSSTNGPDLFVYLSKELQPVQFMNLGPLKSVNGNQVYPLTGTPDVMEYKYALVHCRQFNHLFGSAELVKN